MQAAQLLPNFVIGQFDNVVKSVNTYVGPVIGSSLTLMDKWFASSAASDAEEAAAQEQAEYEASPGFLDAVKETAIRIAMGEGTSGLNDDAKILLKKDGNWGVCEDYGECIKELAMREKARPQSGGRLRVKLFFAEQDSMIGQQGQAYMESCWKALDEGDGDCRGVIDVEMKTVPGTDHDGLVGKLSLLNEIMAFMQ